MAQRQYEMEMWSNSTNVLSLFQLKDVSLKQHEVFNKLHTMTAHNLTHQKHK